MFILALLPSMNTILQESLYIGMLVLLLAASLGLPLPEDIPLLFGGCLARLGYGEPFYVVIIGLIGVLTGDIVLYFVGRKWGIAVLEKRPFRKLLTRSHIAQMKVQFRKRGSLIIFFGRFFAGIRSIMCLTAGMSKVPAWKFILLDVSGAMVTVPILVGLGWWFSDNISKVVKGVVAVEHILAILIAAIIVGWIISIDISKRSKLKKLDAKAREELASKQMPDKQTKDMNAAVSSAYNGSSAGENDVGIIADRQPNRPSDVQNNMRNIQEDKMQQERQMQQGEIQEQLDENQKSKE